MTAWLRLRTRFGFGGFLGILVIISHASPAVGQPAWPSFPDSYWKATYPETASSVAATYEVFLSHGEAAAVSFAEANGVAPLAGTSQPWVVLELTDGYQDPSATIQGLGGTVLHVSRASDVGINVVGCHLPAGNLEALRVALQPELVQMRAPIHGEPEQIPLHHGEGANRIGAAERIQNGDTGAGNLVVVLDVGFRNHVALVAAEELPVPVFTQDFRKDGNGFGAGAAVSVHGAACAEIVHEVAPGAAIGLVAIATEDDLLRAVKWIYGLGVPGNPPAHGQTVHIITCSLNFWWHQPHDGTGPLEALANIALPVQSILWVNSASNFGDQHWEGPWADADADDLLDFSAGDDDLTFVMAPGDRLTVSVIWKDPWAGALHDLDIHLRDPVGNIVSRAIEIEPNAVAAKRKAPSAVLSYRVPVAGAVGNYQVQIKHFSGAGAIPDVEVWVRGNFPASLEAANQVAEGSVTAPATAATVEAVGAIDWTLIESGGPLRSYSSRGPTNANVMKPDICAPDGVSSASYGLRDQARSGFTGTSAAAPHVAGAAAILRTAGGLTLAATRQALHAGAVLGMGQAGADNTFGHGLLNVGDVLPRFTLSITSSPYAAIVSEQVGMPRQVSGADLIEEFPPTGTPYATLKVPASRLGLLPGEEVDALSLNTQIVFPLPQIFFSVDENSVGLAGTAVAAQVAALNESAAPDIFHSAFDNQNALVSDGDGNDPAGLTTGHGLYDDIPVNSIDDLDGLDLEDVAPGMDWLSAEQVYFSVDSPTAIAHGVDPADVLIATPLGLVVYATRAALLLQVGDDIDALVVQDNGIVNVFDVGDEVLYSLRTGSPTLLANGDSPADVYSARFLPGGVFRVVLASAADLGLAATDELDALDVSDLFPPPAPTTPEFIRGGCNGLDANVNIADAIYLLGVLFPGPGGMPNVVTCRDACDSNDDGTLNIADAIAVLGSLFGSPALPLPPPNVATGCGPDTTPDGLDCGTWPCP